MDTCTGNSLIKWPSKEWHMAHKHTQRYWEIHKYKHKHTFWVHWNLCWFFICQTMVSKKNHFRLVHVTATVKRPCWHLANLLLSRWRTADTSGKRILDGFSLLLLSSFFLSLHFCRPSSMKFRSVNDRYIFTVEPTNGTLNARVTTYDCSSSPFSLDIFPRSCYHVSRSRFHFIFHFTILYMFYSLDWMLEENMTHLSNNNWMSGCTQNTNGWAEKKQ